MIFYGYFRSSSAYRCRIAFNLKGVRPETRLINLRQGEQHSPAYLAVNPQGLVPALDTGAGVLAQSLAIIEWLDEAYPTPPFLPGDAVARGQIRAFAQLIASEIHPLHNLRVLNKLGEDFGQDQNGKDAWARNWIACGLTACEQIAVAQDHGGRFVFGDNPTLADICLIPQMVAAERFGLSLAPFTRLNSVRAAADAMTAFADAHPARQPDAIDAPAAIRQ